MRRYQNRSRVSYQKIPTHVILTLSVAKGKDPSAAEPQPTLPYVILSRRSAAKNLRLRSLRSFAVYAAQDDGASKSSLHAKILGCSSSECRDRSGGASPTTRLSMTCT